MRIKILGAGPAGLYLAILLKRSGVATELSVFEQNAPESTFGFGVVFSHSALEFLKEDDPDIHEAITPTLQRWSDIKVVHRGETIRIDGVGFTAVGRLYLLQLLQQKARQIGIDLQFNRVIENLDELNGADLIVGADGINSLVRRADENAFGTRVSHLTNRFAWFGTTKRFDVLTQTFVKHARGHFNAHHYRYSDAMSTFIVETDAATFANGDLAGLGEADLKAVMEDVFADTLDGHALVSNRSAWRQFPVISNETWSHRNTVILGDALHTAHFSIGSGTRLALEDAIALARALKAESPNIPRALARYQADRKPILDILVGAANASAAWYETFADKMALAPYDFAMSYLLRTGRMTPDKLKRVSPLFMGEYERHRHLDPRCPNADAFPLQ
jgi:2-polyprenyl-6-methoxyphenol hydroxylase-like FAD-dependent oxidoreductase